LGRKGTAQRWVRGPGIPNRGEFIPPLAALVTLSGSPPARLVFLPLAMLTKRE
jgi:hypothetical protein